jgi:hypothetical protein
MESLPGTEQKDSRKTEYGFCLCCGQPIECIPLTGHYCQECFKHLVFNKGHEFYCSLHDVAPNPAKGTKQIMKINSCSVCTIQNCQNKQPDGICFVSLESTRFFKISGRLYS